MTTPSEQATLAKLRAGTHVVVPQSAIDWLFGAGPDENGIWFDECQDLYEIEAVSKGFPLPAFWWRKVFRVMIQASQEDG